MKYTKRKLEKLEDILGELGFKVRYEKGHFQAGHCLVMDQKLVVINKFFDTEGRIQTLLDLLQEIEWEEEHLSDRSRHFLKGLQKELQSEKG